MKDWQRKASRRIAALSVGQKFLCILHILSVVIAERHEKVWRGGLETAPAQAHNLNDAGSIPAPAIICENQTEGTIMGGAAKEAVPVTNPFGDIPLELGVFLDTLDQGKGEEILSWLNKTPDAIDKMKSILSPVSK
jgi:hypothetical protein